MTSTSPTADSPTEDRPSPSGAGPESPAEQGAQTPAEQQSAQATGATAARTAEATDDPNAEQETRPTRARGAAPESTTAPGALFRVPRERWQRIARVAGVPFAVFGGSTVLHLVILAAMNPAGGASLSGRLLAWDSQWYLDIARHGYSGSYSFTPGGPPADNTLAFFPAYPFLVRVVHTVTGLGYDGAALLTSHLALLAALVCVHALVVRLYGRRTAVAMTVLVAAAQPMALVFLMAYSESLFLAFAAGTLLALHRRSWLTAGALALLAGLTRPAAVAVIAALGVAVLLDAVRERRLAPHPTAALALACCGTPAYLLWVGVHTGRMDAWFAIQEAGWGTHWDNGGSFFDFLGQTLAHGDGWIPVSTALLLLAVLACTAFAWWDGVWPPLLVYGTVVTVLTFGQSNYYHSKLRLLIPALVFLLPLARALARARTRAAAVALAAASLFGCWFGAYMLTVWPYAI